MSLTHLKGLWFACIQLLDRVYKVEKALYRLHQAPRAWYETLSTYLLDSGFQRGKIDKTLFIRRDKGDIMLVQVYVDDIIFGFTKKSLCTEFEKMMHKKFQMSSMGELTFFLGLQVKQKGDGIFISQDKYMTEILKKFGFTDVKTTSTPMETQKPLLKDEDGEDVDVHLYRSMIGSLMYLTYSRPDIMFAVCACARYQVNPKVSHLHAVKRIFRYLKGQPKLGIWYLKDSPFDLIAYTDSNYAGYEVHNRRLPILWKHNLLLLLKVNAVRHNLLLLLNVNAVEVDFLNANPIRYALTINPTIYTSCIEQLWATIKVKTINEEVQLQALVDGKKVIITESTVRRDLHLENAEGVDCLPSATIFEQLTLIGAKTTAWNEFSSTMASAIICLATNQKFNFSKYIFESMVKNLDSEGKFLMYPRFVQVFLEKQLERISNHKRIYVTPSHTKKIFRNMRRVGKCFSRRETPLFPTMVVQAQEEMGEGGLKKKDNTIPNSRVPYDNVADEAVNEEMDDSLVRASTTASGLEAKQDSGNIDKTQSKETPNESSSPGTSSGGAPKRQETMKDIVTQTRSENVSKLSNDPLLARGNTLRSGENRLKLKELMEFCTKLQQNVLALENTKTAQPQEITSLKLRFKKLEKKGGSRTHKLKILHKVGRSAKIVSSNEASLGNQEDASKQGRKIDDIDKDAEITLVDETQGRYGDDIMFDVSDLAGEEVFVAEQGVLDSKKNDVVNTAGVARTAQALAELKSDKPTTAASTRPRAKGLAIHEQQQAPTPTVSSQQPSQAKIQDKGKAKMIEPEFVKKLSKKDKLKLDEEVAQKLQAEFDEQERIEREKNGKEEELLAERLQAREQEEFTIKERAILFQQLLEKRRKHFAVKRAEEKRNKPPTRAQQRSIMCTYLKNMEGWKPKHLKIKSFENIQELFNKAMKRVNTFVDYRTELVEGSLKKADAEIA
ncbi:putative ribonuclease H-like domain-containing protein [Tanacetum coccineum]